MALSTTDKKRITEMYQEGQRFQSNLQFRQAIEAYHSLLKEYPTVAEAHFQIARIEHSDSHFVEAKASVEAALKLRPMEESLWLLMADIVRDEGRQPVATILARARKVGLPPDMLGRIERRYAKPSPRGATRQAPEAAQPFLQRAGNASGLEDDQTALKMINRALKKAPDSPEVLSRRADVLLTLGDLDGALADSQRCVQLKPKVGHYWAIWARVKKIKSDNPLIPELERHYEASAAGSDDRRQMAYALAKVMEDTRADDRLFKYLNEANDLTARRFPYKEAGDELQNRWARETYTPALVSEIGGKGPTDVTPIFVTGLPRSGTTLTEQIISSHPMVTAGGEMGIVNNPISKAVEKLAEGDASGADMLIEAGQQFVEEVGRRFPGKKIVTDKSITTHVNIGQIPLALSNAKVIIVRRDPRDSCLAILKSRFSDGAHRYTYSMEWAAGFYKLFANQIAFWRKAAPDSFIEVKYEDIIADQEGQSRRLIEYCGLPWDEACLNFHENERRVKTLSSAQVRQPLYSSSVGAWKRYEKDLQPLLDALGPIEDLP
jgi:tetratricopeptide (TPR) repeat protein